MWAVHAAGVPQESYMYARIKPVTFSVDPSYQILWHFVANLGDKYSRFTRAYSCWKFRISLRCSEEIKLSSFQR